MYLIIATLLSLIGRPDLDILFSLFSDKDARLYIFTPDAYISRLPRLSGHTALIPHVG